MQAEDAAALREGVRGRELEPGPGLLRTVIVRVVGARAAASSGDPIAVEHDVADGETCRSAPSPTTRRATPPATWPCCCRGTAASSSPATPPPTCVRLGLGPIYEDVDEGVRSLSRLAALQFETALFAHGRPLAPRASERFRARFARG